MVSCEPVIRWCMSLESSVGTMRSLSPLAISVGWVIRDRSAGTVTLVRGGDLGGLVG